MFSVVIPLFNKELSVESTIKSVLNQNYKDFEIVVVNDGSTDGSVAVIEKINDCRIRIIHQKNQGVSAARNAGIREAKNEWIAFLDADDLWMENHLDEIFNMMKVYPNENVFVTSFVYSTRQSVDCFKNNRKVYLIRNFFKEYFPFRDLIHTITVVIRKKTLVEVGGFDTRLCLGEDMDLWARLGRKYSLVKSDVNTAIYRVEAENRSDEGSYKMKKSFLAYIDFDKMDSPEEKKFYAFWLKHKMKHFIKTVDVKNFFFLLKKYKLNLLH